LAAFEQKSNTGATGNFGALPNPPNSAVSLVGEQFLDGGGEQRQWASFPCWKRPAPVGCVRRPTAFVGPAAGDGLQPTVAARPHHRPADLLDLRAASSPRVRHHIEHLSERLASPHTATGGQ
jgi:hypothetical protein